MKTVIRQIPVDASTQKQMGRVAAAWKRRADKVLTLTGTNDPSRLMSSAMQGKAWENAFGKY